MRISNTADKKKVPAPGEAIVGTLLFYVTALWEFESIDFLLWKFPLVRLFCELGYDTSAAYWGHMVTLSSVSDREFRS